LLYIKKTISAGVKMYATTFDDVLIIPKKSNVESRKNVDLSVDFKKFKLKIPIISSNMKSVTGASMVKAIGELGGLGILHRFHKYHYDLLKEYESVLLNRVNTCNEKYNFACSVGVNDEDKKTVEIYYQNFQNYFSDTKNTFIVCIDISHGHSLKMEKMIKFLRDKFGNEICIIGGNITTASSAIDLIDWGADIVKVGIGSGSVCTTRHETGVGMPLLFALKTIREAVPDIKMIADGGIKHVGDIAKALVYADACMLGAMLSATTETPGNVFQDMNGERFKLYFGSASSINKIESGQNDEYIEGTYKHVNYKGSVENIIKRIKNGLQSSFSFVGASNIEEFKKNAEFINISAGGMKGSKL
jgi:IMP dehydrogenase